MCREFAVGFLQEEGTQENWVSAVAACWVFDAADGSKEVAWPPRGIDVRAATRAHRPPEDNWSRYPFRLRGIYGT
jgi:hypothetical protein